MTEAPKTVRKKHDHYYLKGNNSTWSPRFLSLSLLTVRLLSLSTEVEWLRNDDIVRAQHTDLTAQLIYIAIMGTTMITIKDYVCDQGTIKWLNQNLFFSLIIVNICKLFIFFYDTSLTY
jgi:hypothetical protein